MESVPAEKVVSMWGSQRLASVSCHTLHTGPLWTGVWLSNLKGFCQSIVATWRKNASRITEWSPGFLTLPWRAKGDETTASQMFLYLVQVRHPSVPEHGSFLFLNSITLDVSFPTVQQRAVIWWPNHCVSSGRKLQSYLPSDYCCLWGWTKMFNHLINLSIN